jgi:phosphoribosylaminoimidazolecarboxamide formyltransferase/IMP cyclohydrolase
VHAGLLADTRRPEHLAQLAELGIAPFELLVSNLYPFTATVASGATPDECVEQIDVGGPAMVRASAKNHDSVAVVVDPTRYDWVLETVKDGGFTLADRRALAVTAFRHTATYDVAVASYLGSVVAPDGNPFPGWVGATWDRAATLRYGENPHQAAALYASGAPGLAVAEQLSGKEMSYNNYVDADAAWRAAHDHGDVPCVAVIKHANPCGIAIGADVAEAHRKAHATDPTSAFGGVIAVNGEVSVELAEQIAEIFTEVVVAPAYAEGASAVLAERRNLRVLRLPVAPPRGGAELRPVSGGLLLQQRDSLDAPGDDPTTWTLATGDPVDDDVLADLVFAWRACRSVKSNAILLATDGAAVGVGMGQVNRVDAARLAVARAGDRARGSVAASDAYFPFPDGLQVLLDAGVRAVVQPGGSVRDPLSVEAAAAAGVPMYFTGTRHFAH